MSLIRIMERGGEDVHRFEEGLKMAKQGLTEACEIWEDMKAQLSERGGYGERYSQRYGERYSSREWDEMPERRGRDSMGRYR